MEVVTGGAYERITAFGSLRDIESSRPLPVTDVKEGYWGLSNNPAIQDKLGGKVSETSYSATNNLMLNLWLFNM